MPFAKRVGEHVSNWIGHPVEAIVLSLIVSVCMAVLSAFFLPSPSAFPCVAIGAGLFAVLIIPYWILRRNGYLEPDVPFTFGSVSRPARLTVYRMLTVYIAGRMAKGQKRFGLPELSAVMYTITAALCTDGEPSYALYGNLDHPIQDVDEVQLLSALRLFVHDEQVYEESGMYHVTMKGELIFSSSARAAYETDPMTITMLCEDLGLELRVFARDNPAS